jgi:antitoxin ParD1/3/4
MKRSMQAMARDALRDWKIKRALQLQEIAPLKADLGKGLTDLAEGRFKDFDAARIIERGRRLLASCSPSV